MKSFLTVLLIVFTFNATMVAQDLEVRKNAPIRSNLEDSLVINVKQAGTLSSYLSPTKMSETSYLIITGEINALDFKIMRDYLPHLRYLDISKTIVKEYVGTEGTSTEITTYPASELPNCAFNDPSSRFDYRHNIRIILPSTLTSIGKDAFDLENYSVTTTLPSSMTKCKDLYPLKNRTLVAVQSNDYKIYFIHYKYANSIKIEDVKLVKFDSLSQSDCKNIYNSIEELRMRYEDIDISCNKDPSYLPVAYSDPRHASGDGGDYRLAYFFHNGEIFGINCYNGIYQDIKKRSFDLLNKNDVKNRILSNNLTVDFIIKNCYNLYSDISCYDIKNLVNNNMLAYYQLNNKFNTPLKKKLFQKTNEFANLKASFNKERANFSDLCYYFTISADAERDNLRISNYDLNKGAFNLDFKAGSYWYTMFDPINQFDGRDFAISVNGIPFSGFVVDNKTWTRMKLYVNTKNALNIENNRDKIDVYFIIVDGLRVGNIYSDKSQFFCQLYGHAPVRSEYQREYYVANKVRLVLVNRDTNEIYYSKLYSHPSVATKK